MFSRKAGGRLFHTAGPLRAVRVLYPSGTSFCTPPDVCTVHLSQIPDAPCDISGSYRQTTARRWEHLLVGRGAIKQERRRRLRSSAMSHGSGRATCDWITERNACRDQRRIALTRLCWRTAVSPYSCVDLNETRRVCSAQIYIKIRLGLNNVTAGSRQVSVFAAVLYMTQRRHVSSFSEI